jgi:hypothetical protein
VAFLIAVPLAWGILLLFHPGGDGKAIYADLHDQVGRMLLVHVGMLVFIPLMAAAVYLMLRGVEGTAATVARIALVPFVVLYTAWESLQGIANGVLVDEANGLPASQRDVAAGLIQDFAESPLVRDAGALVIPASLALVTAMVAAGIALHRYAGAPQSVAVLLAISGFLISAHPPPFGPIGLALFIAAVLIYTRGQATEPAPQSVPRPSSA